MSSFGKVQERLNWHAWRACVPLARNRGFESHPFRMNAVSWNVRSQADFKA